MTNTLPPAHWAADPSGRHEHRYWDGSQWTDHVADGGTPSIDPLVAPVVVEPAIVEPVVEPVVVEPAVPEEPAPDEGAGYAAPTMAMRPPPPPAPGTGLVGSGTVAGAPTTWRSMDGLKTALVVLFICVAVASVAVFATRINRVSATDDFERNLTVSSLHSLHDADDAVDAANTVHSLLLLAIIVCFIIWQFRGAKNVEVLGRAGARFGPGWSIGGWFIPFANFVIPVMIIQGFWRATTPGTGPGTSWQGARRSALVGFWWAALLGSYLTNFTFNNNDTPDDLRTSDRISAVGSVLSLIAAVLAILVVVQLTRRFNERRAEPASVG